MNRRGRHIAGLLAIWWLVLSGCAAPTPSTTPPAPRTTPELTWPEQYRLAYRLGHNISALPEPYLWWILAHPEAYPDAEGYRISWFFVDDRGAAYTVQFHDTLILDTVLVRPFGQQAWSFEEIQAHDDLFEKTPIDLYAAIAIADMQIAAEPAFRGTLIHGQLFTAPKIRERFGIFAAWQVMYRDRATNQSRVIWIEPTDGTVLAIDDEE